MHRFLLNTTLYVLATVIVSCLLTTMVMFISTGSSGSDIHTLLATQTVATPLALTIVIVDLLLYARSGGVGHGLRMIWSGTPAWLILALVVLNSLVIIGELSFLLLVHQYFLSPRFWTSFPHSNRPRTEIAPLFHGIEFLLFPAYRNTFDPHYPY